MTDDTHAGYAGSTRPNRMRRFTDTLRELSESRDVDETLRLVVDLAVDVVDSVDAADVMFVRSEQVTTPVSSSSAAEELDVLQHEVGEGPCLGALREVDGIVSHDLAVDDRWPRFTPRALDLGFRSVAAYRLFVERGPDGDAYGALNLFGREPGFDDHELELGSILAAHCSVLLRSTIENDGAEVALLEREVIGEATGILAMRHALPPQEANELLRRAAAEQGMAVPLLASEVVAGTRRLR